MKGQTNKRDPWYPERSWPAKFAWTGFYLLLLALLMLLCLAIDREFAPRIHPAWLSRLFSIAIFGCGLWFPHWLKSRHDRARRLQRKTESG